MNTSEIKVGLPVCVCFKGTPIANTTVLEHPFEDWGQNVVWLNGIDEPIPVTDLKPYKKGYYSSREEINAVK